MTASSPSASLVEALEQRRDIARKDAEQVARAGSLANETRLEGALADFERYDGQIQRLVRVGREPLVYEPGNHRRSYFADLLTAHHGEEMAQRRLERHAQEIRVEMGRLRRVADAAFANRLAPLRGSVERRDLTRTDTAGGNFVPPLWVIEMFAGGLRAGRVLADRIGSIPLPSGTDSISVPRVTTGAATAIQTADGAAVQETDIVDAGVTMPIRTIAGQIDASYQLVDQAHHGFDAIAAKELLADYDAKLDAQLIAGTGVSGQLLGLIGTSGVNTLAYTDASPTAAEFQAKVASAAADLATARMRAPEIILMHPRRWYWITAAVDSSLRPIVPPDSDVEPGQVAERPGTLCSLPVWISTSVPANLGAGLNQDLAIVTRPSDHLLFESTPSVSVSLAPLDGNLTARFHLRAYCAFTAGLYPSGTTLVNGTGTVSPTF